jgi:hypothetical protein
MGMLLGLIFYFLIRGGLLAVMGPSQEEITDLNNWGLAAIGALVGLFSRNAISKLREIFRTMFRTEDGLRARLAILSGDVRDKLIAALPEPIRKVLLFGTGDELKAALKALPPSEKEKLLQEIPPSTQALFEGYLTFSEGDKLIETLKGLAEEDRKKLWEIEHLKTNDATELLISENGARLVVLFKSVEETELTGLSDDGQKAVKPFVKTKGEVLLGILNDFSDDQRKGLVEIEKLKQKLVADLIKEGKGEELVEALKDVKLDELESLNLAAEIKTKLGPFLKPPEQP